MIDAKAGGTIFMRNTAFFSWFNTHVSRFSGCGLEVAIGLNKDLHLLLSHVHIWRSHVLAWANRFNGFGKGLDDFFLFLGTNQAVISNNAGLPATKGQIS